MSRRILCLGGGVDQVELIRVLQARDCEVFCVDRNPSAPARDLVSKFFPVDSMNLSEIRVLVKKEEIDQIAVASTERPLLVASQISEELGLWFPITHQQAQEVVDKSLMKKLMQTRGVSTPASRVIGSLDELYRSVDELNLPQVLKPVDSSGSRGVHAIEGKANLKQIWESSRSFSHSARCILEELKEGVEISVDAVVREGRVQILMISDNHAVRTSDRVGLVVASRYPSQVAPQRVPEVQKILQQISDQLGLKNTLFFGQMILTKEDAFVIEYCARNLGGSKINFMKFVHGLNLMEVYADILLERTWSGKPPEHEGKEVIVIYIYAQPGRFMKLQGFPSENENEAILYRPEGSRVGGMNDRGDRIAALFFTGDRAGRSALQAADECLDQLKVIGESGENLFDRKPYRSVFTA